MRNLMKHVWILFLPSSTTVSFPMSSHSLHVEWLTPANHRPSHFHLGLKSVSMESSPWLPLVHHNFTSDDFFMPCHFHIILTVIIFDMLVNSWSIVIWCMSPLSVDHIVLQGQRLHYFILLSTWCSVCKLK